MKSRQLTVMMCTLIRMCSHRVDLLCRCCGMRTVYLVHTIKSIHFLRQNRRQWRVPDVPNSHEPLLSCCNHLTMCTVKRFHYLVQWKFAVSTNGNRQPCIRMACIDIYLANIGPNRDATIRESSYKVKREKSKTKLTAAATATTVIKLYPN